MEAITAKLGFCLGKDVVQLWCKGSTLGSPPPKKSANVFGFRLLSKLMDAHSVYATNQVEQMSFFFGGSVLHLYNTNCNTFLAQKQTHVTKITAVFFWIYQKQVWFSHKIRVRPLLGRHWVVTLRIQEKQDLCFMRQKNSQNEKYYPLY